MEVGKEDENQKNDVLDLVLSSLSMIWETIIKFKKNIHKNDSHIEIKSF